MPGDWVNLTPQTADSPVLTWQLAGLTPNTSYDLQFSEDRTYPDDPAKTVDVIFATLSALDRRLGWVELNGSRIFGWDFDNDTFSTEFTFLTVLGDLTCTAFPEDVGAVASVSATHRGLRDGDVAVFRINVDYLGVQRRYTLTVKINAATPGDWRGGDTLAVAGTETEVLNLVNATILGQYDHMAIAAFDGVYRPDPANRKVLARASAQFPFRGPAWHAGFSSDRRLIAVRSQANSRRVPPTAPVYQLQLSATPEDGSVFIFWVHNSAFDSYRWRYLTPSGWTPYRADMIGTTGGTPPTRHVTIRNISNGTAYTFEVQGILFGQPVATATVTATPTSGDAMTVPGEEITGPGDEPTGPDDAGGGEDEDLSELPTSPRSLGGTSGDRTLTATWSAPDDLGALRTGADGVLTRYEYRVRRDGGSWGQWTSRGTARTVTLTGLLNGSVYEVQVRAVTTAGTSAAIAQSYRPAAETTTVDPGGTVTPPEDEEDQPDRSRAPAAVRNLTATATSTRVVLDWVAPFSFGTVRDGTAAALRWYEYRRRTTGAWSAWTIIGTATEATVSGLVNGVVYQFQVRAVSASGSGTLRQVSSAPTTEGPVTTDPSDSVAPAEIPDDTCDITQQPRYAVLESQIDDQVAVAQRLQRNIPSLGEGLQAAAIQIELGRQDADAARKQVHFYSNSLFMLAVNDSRYAGFARSSREVQTGLPSIRASTRDGSDLADFLAPLTAAESAQLAAAGGLGLASILSAQGAAKASVMARGGSLLAQHCVEHCLNIVVNKGAVKKIAVDFARQGGALLPTGGSTLALARALEGTSGQVTGFMSTRPLTKVAARAVSVSAAAKAAFGGRGQGPQRAESDPEPAHGKVGARPDRGRRCALELGAIVGSALGLVHQAQLKAERPRRPHRRVQQRRGSHGERRQRLLRRRGECRCCCCGAADPLRLARSELPAAGVVEQPLSRVGHERDQHFDGEQPACRRVSDGGDCEPCGMNVFGHGSSLPVVCVPSTLAPAADQAPRRVLLSCGRDRPRPEPRERSRHRRLRHLRAGAPDAVRRDHRGRSRLPRLPALLAAGPNEAALHLGSEQAACFERGKTGRDRRHHLRGGSCVRGQHREHERRRQLPARPSVGASAVTDERAVPCGCLCGRHVPVRHAGAQQRAVGALGREQGVQPRRRAEMAEAA